MKKLMVGLVMCGLGLMVGCQSSSSSGSTTKKEVKSGTETTKETKAEPKAGDGAKPADDKKPPA
jgi:hypothetical protein